MADPATNTAYPAALEVFPEILSGARMIDPDVRHDRMHDKAHATLNAIQALLGTVDEDSPQPILERIASLSRGGVLIQCGSKSIDADPLGAGVDVSGLAPCDYRLTGWQMWCYPAGSMTVDIRVGGFAAAPPSAADSICGEQPPSVVGAELASGEVGGWAVDVPRGSAITAVVAAASSVRWFALLLLGDKT